MYGEVDDEQTYVNLLGIRSIDAVLARGAERDFGVLLTRLAGVAAEKDFPRPRLSVFWISCLPLPRTVFTVLERAEDA